MLRNVYIIDLFTLQVMEIFEEILYIQNVAIIVIIIIIAIIVFITADVVVLPYQLSILSGIYSK